MKCTFIGHASLLVEIQGLTILSDPWWRGPCFGAQWWLYPEPHLEVLKDRRLDYIYISHGHEDHFHPGTLKTLNTSARVLLTKGSDLSSSVRKLGFEVIEVDEYEILPLGNGVTCRIVPTYEGDTFLTLSDGQETLANLNDSIHSLPSYIRKRFIKRIKEYHPEIDYVFCGYGTASHFPNCYIIPGKDWENTARKRQLFFNHSWSHIIQQLAPRFGFPFAADVVLLEDDLLWSNEPVHNVERPPEVFQRLYPNAPTTVLDIAPGFVIADGEVISPHLRTSVSGAKLKDIYHDKIMRANRYGSITDTDIEQVRDLLDQNISKHHAYLKGFKVNYKILIRFRNSPGGLEVTKQGERFQVHTANVPAEDYDLTYTTRLAYLRRSLTTPYGHETLFVGSGGVFEYIDSTRAMDNLHEELMVMVSQKETTGSRGLKNLKQKVKNILNRDEFDLYNLKRWTVYV